MNCANCPTQKEINAWVEWYKDCHGEPPFAPSHCEELREKCKQCNPDAENHHGVSHVSMDVMGGAAGGVFKIKDDYIAGKRANKENLTPLTPEAEEAMLRFFHEFAQLSLADAEILHCVLNGMDTTQIATAFGYANRAAVHARLKSAMERNPWIEAIYTRGHYYGAKMGRQSKTWKRWDGKKTLKRGNGGMPLAYGPGVSPDELAPVETLDMMSDGLLSREYEKICRSRRNTHPLATLIRRQIFAPYRGK